ncbi:MAG: 4-alpha-glucanotransferase [Betaproteobacteria bacterium]
MSDAGGTRRAGVLVPLFSCPSDASWGIGDIGDIATLAAWLAAAGQRVLQLLPMNEMAPGLPSPYSAISAMAIDPIYIRVPDVPEFRAAGGEDALDDDVRSMLEAARRSGRIDYSRVRAAKGRALRSAFERFRAAEWSRDTARAAGLRSFLAAQAWWVEDYALFRALHGRDGERPWTEWPDALRQREAGALDRARRELAGEILHYQYLQWIADSQWHAARAAARARRVALFGDLPFMVDGDSADVWARQGQFRLDASVGAPPDAFSAAGQDWGMPVYRWEAVEADGFRWLRDRARRSADLYDGYRVDHLVGFYRTYGRPHREGEPFFTPDEESAQTELGERVLTIFREPGPEIIAEDLGTVPDFVRASLRRLGIPGYRVLRWERRWNEEGQPFVDPAEYPPASVATSGTHDTEPLAVWWDAAPAEERRELAALETVRRLAGGRDVADQPFTPALRDTLLEALFASGSSLLVLPLCDVFGWRDRINDPATISDDNWTYRLPWPIDRLDEIPEARERRDALRAWASRYGRL